MIMQSIKFVCVKMRHYKTVWSGQFFCFRLLFSDCCWW